MKLFLSGSKASAATVSEFGRVMESDHEIVSRWHEEEEQFRLFGAMSEDDVVSFKQAHSKMMYEDLDKADAVVLYLNFVNAGLGNTIDIGYAIGKGMPVVVVAEEKRFLPDLLQHPNVVFVSTPDEAKLALYKAQRTISAYRNHP